MQCKSCKYPHSEVVYTRHDEQKDHIIRRRACLRCGLRYTTKEQQKETNDDRFPRAQRT